MQVTKEDSHPFQLTIEKLEIAYKRAMEQVGIFLN